MPQERTVGQRPGKNADAFVMENGVTVAVVPSHVPEQARHAAEIAALPLLIEACEAALNLRSLQNGVNKIGGVPERLDVLKDAWAIESQIRAAIAAAKGE